MAAAASGRAKTQQQTRRKNTRWRLWAPWRLRAPRRLRASWWQIAASCLIVAAGLLAASGLRWKCGLEGDIWRGAPVLQQRRLRAFEPCAKKPGPRLPLGPGRAPDPRAAHRAMQQCSTVQYVPLLPAPGLGPPVPAHPTPSAAPARPGSPCPSLAAAGPNRPRGGGPRPPAPARGPRPPAQAFGFVSGPFWPGPRPRAPAPGPGPRPPGPKPRPALPALEPWARAPGRDPGHDSREGPRPLYSTRGLGAPPSGPLRGHLRGPPRGPLRGSSGGSGEEAVRRGKGRPRATDRETVAAAGRAGRLRCSPDGLGPGRRPAVRPATGALWAASGRRAGQPGRNGRSSQRSLRPLLGHCLSAPRSLRPPGTSPRPPRRSERPRCGH